MITCESFLRDNDIYDRQMWEKILGEALLAAVTY